MKNSQRGFIGIALLIILGLAVIGGGAYYYHTKGSAKVGDTSEVSLDSDLGENIKLNDYSNIKASSSTTSNNAVVNTSITSSTPSPDLKITSITPNPAYVGQTVTIYGKGFNSISKVDFYLNNLGLTGVSPSHVSADGTQLQFSVSLVFFNNVLKSKAALYQISVVNIDCGNGVNLKCTSNIESNRSDLNLLAQQSGSSAGAGISDWKTYANFGFSFNYPNNIILAPTGARSAVDFFLDNPSDANMVTFSADDPAATCNDMDNATGPNGVHNYKGEGKIINGVSFHKAELSEGFAGGSSHSIDYYTVHNNGCYDLRFSHTSYTSTLSELAAISMFENIISTFKFTN